MTPLAYLVDTSVISQTEKSQPEPAVAHWWFQQNPAGFALSAVVITELRLGIELHAPGRRQNELRQWLEWRVLTTFKGRILPVDAKVADQCGRLIASTKKAGHTAEMADALIAATAMVHGLKLATLNRKHFERLGVGLVTFRLSPTLERS